MTVINETDFDNDSRLNIRRRLS